MLASMQDAEVFAFESLWWLERDRTPPKDFCGALVGDLFPSARADFATAPCISPRRSGRRSQAFAELATLLLA